MQIKDRTALVTGGARGIGCEITRQLVEKGSHVIIVGRDESHINEAVACHGDAVSGIITDLADADSVDRLILDVTASHPDLAILVNNAAQQTEMDLVSPAGHNWSAEIRQEAAINLVSAMALCAGLLPLLKKQPEASVLNVTSALAIAPKRAAPVYSATKAGLRSFTRSLRYQCRRQAPHIRIGEIVMALVDTDMTRGRGSGKITAPQAAASIVKALETDAEEIWVSKARLLRFINRFSPATAARILR